MRKPFGRDYVQVRLGAHLYTFYCPGREVGELVQIPPNDYVPRVQTVRVERLGRGYFGRVRKAWPVPARGLEDERGDIVALTAEEARHEPVGDLFDPQAADGASEQTR